MVDRTKKIKAVSLDCDGVFFDGKAYIHPQDGEVFKVRSLVDGQGISLLRAAGVRIGFFTAEKSGFIEKVCEKLNNLPSVKNGTWPPIGVFSGLMGHEKVEAVEKWLSDAGVSWEECAHMGDDLSDYEVMQKVGLAAAPAQAEAVIKKLVHFVAERHGGDGAIRDLANFILEAKGVDVTALARR